jgi:hypothetical protein
LKIIHVSHTEKDDQPTKVLIEGGDLREAQIDVLLSV